MDFTPLKESDVKALLAETRQSVATREEKVNVLTAFLNSGSKSARNVEKHFPRAISEKNQRSLATALKTIVRDDKLPMQVVLSKLYGICFVAG
jgi:hypothetical protein